MTPQEFERLYFNKNAGPLTEEDFKRLGIRELWRKWDELPERVPDLDFKNIISENKQIFQKKNKNNGKSQ